MAGVFFLVREKIIPIQQLSPALFEVDIMGHRLQAVFETQDEKFDNALSLLRKTFFSEQYLIPGKAMMRDLAYGDYAPAQFVHANLIMLGTADEAGRGEAMIFYQKAADHGYQPAQIKLAEISGTPL